MLAFVLHKDRLFLAETVSPPAPGEPDTAVTQLIRGIYQKFPDQARHIVRSRIYLDHEPSFMCQMTIKVAAKRASVLTPTAAQEMIESARAQFQTIQLAAPPHPMATAMAMAQPILTPPETISQGQAAFERLDLILKQMPHPSPDTPRFGLNRPIGALLVSAEGRILSFGTNQGATNRTLHAEINALRSFYRAHQKPLPPGTLLYTTLKPCRMCAATLLHCYEDWRTAQIVFRDFDPGPNGRSTCLDVASPDRRRISSSPGDLDRIISWSWAKNNPSALRGHPHA